LRKILFHLSLSLKKQRPFQKLHRKFDNKKRKERERERIKKKGNLDKLMSQKMEKQLIFKRSTFSLLSTANICAF
jgi:hypothetical protein